MAIALSSILAEIPCSNIIYVAPEKFPLLSILLLNRRNLEKLNPSLNRGQFKLSIDSEMLF
jgi:hypothetical protein